ncbi:MAG: Mu-like prophage major head subunit gpT family protein [Clostridiales bacterium]|nr:Mu-like prophage major head subunit gpT family protein [Clostridiales bacterium]
MSVFNNNVVEKSMEDFSRILDAAYKNATVNYTKVATIMSSGTKISNYLWLGSMPKVREWIGNRVINNLSARGYAIENKKFELTVNLKRDTFEDDTVGTYAPIIASIGERFKRHPDKLVFELLGDGFTKRCYDDEMFFSDNHIIEADKSKKVQSNKGTRKLSAESYNQARCQMMLIVDGEGESLGVFPNLLVVPPQLEATAKMILEAETINGTTNINRNTSELLVVPELAKYPQQWYLLDTNNTIKPLIFQERKKMEIVSVTSPTSEYVFKYDEFLYGARARYTAGYGLWQYAYGSTGKQA